ncbi:MAG: glycoside hydrolase family 2 protein [Bacilli bacterium]|nr:glycoside hydrolase family 2 protein [Bacilli bacterium]
MPKFDFNDKWFVRSLTIEGDESKPVTLPHDAMLSEEISPDSEGGVNTAWFVGGDYSYTKKFNVEVPNGGKAILEFEGVYRNAKILLNGEQIFKNDYGYNGFYVDLTPYLKEGENEVEVKCFNKDQPNSRWYSGTGIYRPVSLYLLKERHVLLGSARVFTTSYERGEIRISGKTSYEGKVFYSIVGPNKEEVAKGEISTVEKEFTHILNIPNPKLWNDRHPDLYTITLTSEDKEEESFRFGIRELKYGKEGFFINGERLLLKGACIHHDHGVLGAREYRDAEYRKVALLKECGYNAIRSSHNPLTKAALDACDEMGMYVMDEYVDCWYIHKTKYDYVNELMDNYPEDLRLMVEKDYSHPCVVMYSVGNEVAETSQEKGIELVADFVRILHELDPSRPVTCGVNIFFNALFSMGFGVYSDKKAEGNSQAKAKKKEVGSAFFNKIANFVGSNVMKVGSTLPICDRKTRGSFAKLDVAGYNYALFRYKHDCKKYPERLIVGSETFCCDTAKWMRIAEKYPRVIGDFVWAGMDYLGECGVGSWVNEEDAPTFDHGAGWITAGSGRIDITGRFLGEALFTQVLYGVKPVAMAVVPPREYRLKHSPSAWKYSMAMPHYDFPKEEEGKKCGVEVYCAQDHFELLLNGKVIAKRKCDKNGMVLVKFPYKKGKLEVIAYNKNNDEVGRYSLGSSDKETVLVASPESKPSPNDHLYYVRLRLENGEGDIRVYEKDELKIEDVVGGELLGIGNGCPYHKESYLGDHCLTYLGEAIAVFRVDDEKSFSFNLKSKNHNGVIYKI